MEIKSFKLDRIIYDLNNMILDVSKIDNIDDFSKKSSIKHLFLVKTFLEDTNNKQSYKAKFREDEIEFIIKKFNG